MERRYTTPLLDKLGVKPGAQVALIGIDDEGFETLLLARTDEIVFGPPTPDTDLIFLAADSTADLASLPGLRALLTPTGAIWVVSRKGKAATLRDVEVIAAAKAALLVDNKVVAFSSTHTALRLVIPRALRVSPRAVR